MNAARLASAATLAVVLTCGCGDDGPTVPPPPPDFLFEVSNLQVEPAVGHEGEEHCASAFGWSCNQEQASGFRRGRRVVVLARTEIA